MRPLLTELEVAEILKVSVRTLQYWRLYGRGPTFSRISGMVRYQWDDLRLFVDAGRGLTRRRRMTKNA